jgi:hypothetical protein
MKLLILYTLFTLPILAGCQNNSNKNSSKEKTNQMNEKLIDGIDIRESMFSTKEIELNHYRYKNVLIENIKIKDLIDKDFRKDFFSYLGKREDEDDFKATLFTKLLFIRIQQLSDSDSYRLLSETFKNEAISSNGIELIDSYLVELFLQNPYFFVQQGTKYNDFEIINYALDLLKGFIVSEEFFLENFGYAKYKKGMLILDAKIQKEFSNKQLIERLKSSSKIEVIFSPSFYSDWGNQTIQFTEIHHFFGEQLLSKFNLAERNFYKIHVLSKISKMFVQNDFADNEKVTLVSGEQMGIVVFCIQDSDGYTNLRKEKNASSEILQKIITGSQVEVLDKSDNWWLVKTKEGKKGYVYKTKIKTE